jgi:hypothetical protein
MRKIIALLALMVLVFSCGTLQKLTKKTYEETKDSSTAKGVDSTSVSKISSSKDSTGESIWQKETIVEYYQDWVDSKDSLGATIVVGKQEVSIPKTKMLKRITIRERSSDLTKLTVGSQSQDSTKLSKKEAGKLKASKDTTDQEKVVSHKAKWPYILLALLLLALFIYLYFNKTNPPFL